MSEHPQESSDSPNNPKRSSYKARVFWRLFRKRIPLGLGLRELQIGTICFDPTEMVSVSNVSASPKIDIDKTKQEYHDFSNELTKRYASRALNFPKSWAMGDKSALALYLLVRLMRPKTVLETGVANGHSTFYILKAIMLNGTGSLYSTDISIKAGTLIDETERRHWHLEVLDKRNTKRSFQNLINRIPSIDLFVHDSGNHSYSLQMQEYRSVIGKMSAGSVIASDDVDNSYAFVDFAEEKRARPVFLIDIDQECIKIFGLFKLAQLAV